MVQKEKVNLILYLKNLKNSKKIMRNVGCHQESRYENKCSCFGSFLIVHCILLFQKPKLVYDPSDKHAPYKKINIEEITKSPSKNKIEQPLQPSKTPEQKKLISSSSGGRSSATDTVCTVCNEELEGVSKTTFYIRVRKLIFL